MAAGGCVVGVGVIVGVGTRVGVGVTVGANKMDEVDSVGNEMMINRFSVCISIGWLSSVDRVPVIGWFDT